MLEIINVSKVYDDNQKEALSNINLTIKEGSFTSIVGPSGSGKSTMLNMIAGLEYPTSGQILLDGEPITGPGSDRVVMFQEAALFPWLSVIDNVKFGMRMAGVSKEEQERKAMYYLDMVHLGKYRDFAVHQLSGGMKQRVSLARSLTMDSKILLMDEPFSALDKQTTNILRDEVESIWEKTRKTVILITHSVEEALYLSDEIVVLSSSPGVVKDIFKVDFERPRQIDSPEFVRYRQDILHLVRSEVEKNVQETCS